MATEQQTAVTKAELDASFEDMRGYVETAVETLTEEMDRQFKEVNGKLDSLEGKVDKIMEHLGIDTNSPEGR